MANTTDTGRQCFDCQKLAIGVYEGVIPPAGTMRKALCSDHAPDIPPVEDLSPDPRGVDWDRLTPAVRERRYNHRLQDF